MFNRHIVNAAALTASSAIGKLLFFAASVLIFKILPKDEAGIYGLALAMGTVLAIISELGLRSFIVREVARNHDNIQVAEKLWADAFTLRLFSLPVFTPMLALTLAVANYESSTIWLAVLFFIYASVDSLAMVGKGIFRAVDRMQYDAWITVAGKLLLLIMIVLLSYLTDFTC